MSRIDDLERRLAEFYAAEAPSRAPDQVLASALDTIETTRQHRARWPAWRMPQMTNAIRFGIGAVAVVVASVVGLSLLEGGPRPGLGPPSPGPRTSASAIGSPSPDPSPSPDRPSPSGSLPSPTAPSGEWTGPLQPDAATMPVTDIANDGPDADVGWIDILSVTAGDTGQPRRWDLKLAAAPPAASTLDPAERVIAYGLVLDRGRDGADCIVGISNHAPRRGDYRVWVTDMSSGVTEEQVGPPYGFPIDFVHPDERSGAEAPSGPTRDMIFFFVGGFGQCAAVGEPLRYYAWSSVTDAGRVTAWDYAPDHAWLSWPSVSGTH